MIDQIPGSWTFSDKCRCSGILKHKYKSDQYPGYKIEHYVQYNLFKLKQGNKTLISPKKIDLFNEEFAKIFS